MHYLLDMHNDDSYVKKYRRQEQIRYSLIIVLQEIHIYFKLSRSTLAPFPFPLTRAILFVYSFIGSLIFTNFLLTNSNTILCNIFSLNAIYHPANTLYDKLLFLQFLQGTAANVI